MQPEPATDDDFPTVRAVPWWRTWRASLAAVFLVVALAVALSEVVHVVRAYGRAETEALARNEEMAESLATATEIFIDRYSVIAQTTAQAVFTGPLPSDERRRLLVTVRRTHPEIVSLAAILPDGTVADAEPRESATAAVTERAYFRQIVAGAPLVVSDLLVGRSTASLDIVVAAAARSPDGRLLGVVTVRPAIDRLVREVRPTLRKDAHALVVDRTGRAVIHDGHLELAWEQRDYSRVPIVVSALAGRRAASASLTSPVDGAPILGAMVPIAAMGWAAGVVQPLDTALASATDERQFALVAVAFILILGVALALVTADRLSRPIRALSEGVTALSQGDLAHRVRVNARNEIGQLADHVNAMAARLEAARDREGRAVAEARAVRDRLAFLAGASTQIGASLDYEATLRAVARLVVPLLADGCLVGLADAEHAARPFAVAHVDPAREALLAALHAGCDEFHGPHPAVAAFRTGAPELVVDVTDAWMEAASQDARQLELLRRLGLVSYMAVPLVARGRTLGVVSFLSSGRVYGPEDLQLATELAQRAAVAVDNARLFRAAQEAIRQAQGAVRSRDAFLARASHELRTPLTSALGNVRLLRKAVAGSLKEPPDTLIAVASRNLEQMAALIEDLLDASTLAAGREHLALGPVDLSAVLAASADVIAAQAREKEVTLDIALGKSGPIRGDRLKLEQVFTNLLANAVKFTPPGGQVQISTSVEGEAAVIRVRDTGEGIGLEELERIFEPFYQARTAAPEERSRRRRGAGLGLAICRQIVMLHGGRIWAESEGSGRGSVFVVQLPGTTTGERAA